MGKVVVDGEWASPLLREGMVMCHWSSLCFRVSVPSDIRSKHQEELQRLSRSTCLQIDFHKGSHCFEEQGSVPMILFLFVLRVSCCQKDFYYRNGIWIQQGQNEDTHVCPCCRHPLVRPSASITVSNILIGLGNVQPLIQKPLTSHWHAASGVSLSVCPYSLVSRSVNL